MSRNITRWWIITSFLLVVINSAWAQQFYAVVGVFEQENNAQKFTGYVRSRLHAADYGLNTEKNTFYVYVLRTTNREEAISTVKTLIEEGEFKDSWVFTGQLGTEPEPVVVHSEEPPRETPKQHEDAISAMPDPLPDAPAEGTSVVSFAVPDHVKGKLFRFVLQTADGQPVRGEVHHVDYKLGRDLATYKSDRYIDIVHSSSAKDPMTLVCGIFGYKEVVKFLDYKEPSLTEGASRDAKGAWIIPYQLVRMKKGDVSVMYHVSFYKDAVVMLPRAKPELDELVSMMSDNPAYKIVIHGHCNGNNSRKIIALGSSKNYFNVTGSEDKNGTAKELSKLRAEAVKMYLTDNGIDESRSEIYAWGSQNMLVSETSTNAKLNDRIEIEIQED